MTNVVVPHVFFLEDETRKWRWLEDEMRSVCSEVVVQSDPVQSAKWLRKKAEQEPEFPKRVVFVIDVLIVYAEVTEDWSGAEWSNDTPDVGVHFLDLFLCDKDSPYRDSPRCILTQRRKDDERVQNAVARIDERVLVIRANKTNIFHKLIDGEVREFLIWLENSKNYIEKEQRE